MMVRDAADMRVTHPMTERMAHWRTDPIHSSTDMQQAHVGTHKRVVQEPTTTYLAVVIARPGSQ